MKGSTWETPCALENFTSEDGLKMGRFSEAAWVRYFASFPRALSGCGRCQGPRALRGPWAVAAVHGVPLLGVLFPADFGIELYNRDGRSSARYDLGYEFWQRDLDVARQVRPWPAAASRTGM